ncbi:uncharacterized protein LOC103189486 [Callorhinchus milii]|uniref:uncharacterized protein LOC103189486 n=1 Tax=Callorhinchus milii TaxID=7868 RepID=UPI001C3F7FD1|nr:uncharacterized protein LOC103189486 [Callorhinchus milii]
MRLTGDDGKEDTGNLLEGGSAEALELTVQQTAVNGTLHGSVLLPVSYRTPRSDHVKITWTCQHSLKPILVYTRWCTLLSFQASTLNCSGTGDTAKSYESRTTIFPENASLLLDNLELNDTGTYTVKVETAGFSQAKEINLTVITETVNNSTGLLPNNTTDAGGSIIPMVVVPGSICTVLVLYCLARKRTAAGRRSKGLDVAADTGEAVAQDADGHTPSETIVYAMISNFPSEPRHGAGSRTSDLAMEYASIRFK